MNEPSPIQMQKYLSGIDYPVEKDQIIDKARQEGADEDTMNRLRHLPDRTYNGPNAVSEAFSDAR